MISFDLPVFFSADQLHSPPRCAEIQSMLQQDASATRPYRGFVLDTHALAACPRRDNFVKKAAQVVADFPPTTLQFPDFTKFSL